MLVSLNFALYISEAGAEEQGGIQYTVQEDGRVDSVDGQLLTSPLSLPLPSSSCVLSSNGQIVPFLFHFLSVFKTNIDVLIIFK